MSGVFLMLIRFDFGDLSCFTLLAQISRQQQVVSPFQADNRNEFDCNQRRLTVSGVQNFKIFRAIIVVTEHKYKLLGHYIRESKLPQSGNIFVTLDNFHFVIVKLIVICI